MSVSVGSFEPEAVLLRSQVEMERNRNRALAGTVVVEYDQTLLTLASRDDYRRCEGGENRLPQPLDLMIEVYSRKLEEDGFPSRETITFENAKVYRMKSGGVTTITVMAENMQRVQFTRKNPSKKGAYEPWRYAMKRPFGSSGQGAGFRHIGARAPRSP